MKYIYIVTRIVTGQKYGVAVPNLGVHTSYSKAKSHFDSVVAGRLKYGKATVLWTRYLPKNEYERRIVASLIQEGDAYEELFIEKWPVERKV